MVSFYVESKKQQQKKTKLIERVDWWLPGVCSAGGGMGECRQSLLISVIRGAYSGDATHSMVTIVNTVLYI